MSFKYTQQTRDGNEIKQNFKILFIYNKKNRVSIQATHRLTVKRYEENPFQYTIQNP